MYLRTTRRKNKDGSIVEYYQLAHNERHPDTRKPVARIIHSFGRADELDRDQLVRLCNSIARVCGLKVIDPIWIFPKKVDTVKRKVSPSEYEKHKTRRQQRGIQPLQPGNFCRR